jgi:hypothetical protein
MADEANVNNNSEMSLGIFAGSGITFLHTAVTSKSLNLLYFDGESATLTATGSLDSQTVLLRRQIELDPSDEFTYNETARGEELCTLAQELRLDGFMRMNAGFEILACDITASGIYEAFVSNVTEPGNYVRENDPNLPSDPNRPPPLGHGNDFVLEYGWDWIRSAAWHYGGFGNPGGTRRENRVELDLCGMITFYDPALQSLSGKHVGGIRGKEHYENGWGLRRGHRLLDISKEDAGSVLSWIKQVLRRHRTPSLVEKLKDLFHPPTKCSGSNWQAVTEVIMDSHRIRAIEIADVFRHFQTGQLKKNTMMVRLHELSHGVLTPYFQYPRGATLSLSKVKQQTVSRCSSLFTSHLTPNHINTFEELLKDSISIVLERLCQWEWEIFEWSENHTTNIFRTPNRMPDQPISGPTQDEINHYDGTTGSILKWLGWSTWTDCPTKCATGVSFSIHSLSVPICTVRN